MSDDENAPAKVGAFLDGVSEICREYSCGHLVVHHAGKDESRGARGGGPFEDDADAVFHVTKSSGGFVQVKCTKQKDSESDWKMTFHSDVVRLQDNAAGKTISSLALTLESEVTSSDHDVPNHFSKQNRYSEHDEVAVKQLNERKGSPQKRRELAKAVMGELFPESKRADPGTFKKDVRAYDAHLGRIPVIHRLNGYVCERSEKGVPSSFRKPERRNQRKVKPSRKNPKPTETMKRG